MCPCNKALCREAVCSFVTLFNAACSFINSDSATEVINDENQFSLTRREVPVRGLGVTLDLGRKPCSSFRILRAERFEDLNLIARRQLLHSVPKHGQRNNRRK